MNIKVFWYSIGAQMVIPYESGDFSTLVRKFIVWKSEDDDSLIILAGPTHPGRGIEYHRDLMTVALASSDELRESFKDPIGAGDAREGFIYGWKSTGYEVETPRNLWLPIKEALNLK